MFYRKGEAHGFTVCHGGFEGLPGYLKVRTIAEHDAWIINPEYPYRHFLSAIAKYLWDLRNAAPSNAIRVAFDAVLKDVFINGN